MKDINYIINNLKETLGEKLYTHCINVMNLAVDLAIYYKVDLEKARIAGLLHDCGKLKNINNLDHAGLGAEIAKNEYGVEDEEIINAILYHTTGRENMTMLEKIVYVADKAEPSREYDVVDEVRKLAYSDIDRAIVISFESTFGYLRAKGIDVDKRSFDSYQYLKNRIN